MLVLRPTNAKFLRYDFTPEILRVPYSQPKPVRVTQSQLQYSRVYDGPGGSEMHFGALWCGCFRRTLTFEHPP